MTDIEKIKLKIEKWKEHYTRERLRAETVNGKNVLGARIAMLEEVLVLINHIQEET